MERIVLILAIVVVVIFIQVNWLLHKMRKNITSICNVLNELWFSSLSDDIRLLILAGMSADEVLDKLEKGFRETSFSDEEKQRILGIVKDTEAWMRSSGGIKEKKDG